MAARAPATSEVDRSEAEILDSFVGGLRRLMRALARSVPHDAVVRQTQKRVSLAADACPLAVLEAAGPYLYSYRAAIMAPDPAQWRRFFAPGAFAADLQTAEDLAKRDLAEYLIPKVQEVVGGMPPAQQLEYLEKARELLDDYVDWLLLKA